jgi:hypothetical protein
MNFSSAGGDSLEQRQPEIDHRRGASRTAATTATTAAAATTATAAAEERTPLNRFSMKFLLKSFKSETKKKNHFSVFPRNFKKKKKNLCDVR